MTGPKINGFIRTTRHGTKQVRWRDAEGNERSKTCKTDQDAKLFLLELQTSVLQNTYVDPHAGKQTVRTYSEFWLEHHHARPSTVNSYTFTISRYVLPYLGDVRLADLNYDVLNQWVNTLKGTGISASTVHGAHRVLRAMLSTAVVTRRIGYNPAKGIPLPSKGKPDWFIITPVELEKLLQELDEGVPRTLVLLAAQTGMRWSELAGLTWEHVLLDKALIQVRQSLVESGSRLYEGKPKSLSSIRDIPLPKASVEALQRLKDDDDAVGGLVFRSPRGRPLRRCNFSRNHWDPARSRSGFTKLRFHDLRHSYVTWLMQAGTDPITVRDLAGHESLLTTQIYSHTSAERKRSAIDNLFGGTS